jgi:hypothetical protein
MNPKYLREQAAVCRRIAGGLSWNSSGHVEFTEMAENFEKRATELEFQSLAPQVGDARERSIAPQTQRQQPDDPEKPEREG